MSKILIGGPVYGCHNTGEESILAAIISSFNSSNKISVISFGSEWIDIQFGNIKRYLIKNMFRKPILGFFSFEKKNPIKGYINYINIKGAFKSYELYLCGGGSILSDCPWHALRTLQIAQKCGVKSVLFSVGMSEIQDQSTKNYIKKVCSNVEDIFVRDEFVRDRLIALGIDSKSIRVSYDAAIMTKPNLQFNPLDYLTYKECQRYTDENINIGITLSGEKDIFDRTNLQKITKLISYWREKYKANIFLIPTNYREDQDILIMSKLLSNDVILLKKEILSSDLTAFLTNFNFIISSRLHMNILASTVGTPSIGLVRNSKIIDFAKLIDLKYFEIESPEIEEIIEYSKWIIANRTGIQQNIERKINFMREAYTDSVDYIKNKYSLA